MKSIKRILNQLLAATLLTSVVLACIVPAVGAAYNANYLISDAVFRNSTSMSVADIQNFLASKNSGLTNYKDFEDCGDPGGAHYSTYTAYYACGQYVAASKIIYDAAQVYGVNPRAIMATLQKEESLITDPHPVQGQLNCAMGYSSCGSSSGFFNQVDNGTWDLRFLTERAAGNNSYWTTNLSYPCATAKANFYSAGLFPGNTVTFADSGGTPATITIASASTAALYCYTPYVGPISQTGYSGSYNFVISFEQWWGSTTDACISLPMGAPTPTSHAPVNGDYNGDGGADLSIYRPSDSCWHLRGVGDFGYGQNADIPVPADYNGDRVADAGIYRPSDGTWHVRGVGDFQYGQPGDIPVPGYYSGGAVENIAVYRPSQGGWHIRGVGDFGYGASTDIPVPGDYNGDGVTDVAIYRPGEGGWHIRGVGDFGYGASTDIPVPGDYNGDGKTDIAVYRPSQGGWHIRAVGDYAYGASGDVPVVQTLNAYLLLQYGLISGY